MRVQASGRPMPGYDSPFERPAAHHRGTSAYRCDADSGRLPWRPMAFHPLRIVPVVAPGMVEVRFGSHHASRCSATSGH